MKLAVDAALPIAAWADDIVAAIRDNQIAKGDVLAVARIAGIMGAKRTSELVPLCHPIAVHGVDVDVSVVEAQAATSPAPPPKAGPSTRATVRAGMSCRAFSIWARPRASSRA